MRVDPASGLLEGVRFVESPNQDARPADCDIDLVVLHNISLPPGEYGTGWVERLFCNDIPAGVHPYLDEVRDLRVSAHLLIDREGGITQFVPFHRRAWHAGVSCHQGRERCNDFSIGIELEGSDEVPYEAVQYERLVGVLQALFAAYPRLGPDRITGHEHIAPGRKTDPGPAFDWALLAARLEKPAPAG